MKSRIDKEEIIPSKYLYGIMHNKEIDKIELILIFCLIVLLWQIRLVGVLSFVCIQIRQKWGRYLI